MKKECVSLVSPGRSALVFSVLEVSRLHVWLLIIRSHCPEYMKLSDPLLPQHVKSPYNLVLC